MIYRNASTLKPTDFKVREDGVIIFATWPCSEVGNCPYTQLDIEYAWREEASNRKVLEVQAVDYFVHEENMMREAAVEKVSRMTDYVLKALM